MAGYGVDSGSTNPAGRRPGAGSKPETHMESNPQGRKPQDQLDRPEIIRDIHPLLSI